MGSNAFALLKTAQHSITKLETKQNLLGMDELPSAKEGPVWVSVSAKLAKGGGDAPNDASGRLIIIREAAYSFAHNGGNQSFQQEGVEHCGFNEESDLHTVPMLMVHVYSQKQQGDDDENGTGGAL